MQTILRGLPLLATAALAAQTTHIVGPGLPLPQIRSALAIAVPGDVILVHPGSYGQFEAMVGVTIRAITPHTVFVMAQAAYIPPSCLFSPFCPIQYAPTVLQPPAGQPLHITGITFYPNWVVGGKGWAWEHCVEVKSGLVTFDDCTMSATDHTPLSIVDATVHLQDCMVTSVGTLFTSSALSASSSRVTAVGCVFTSNAGSVTLPGEGPGAGIRLVNSILHATDVVAIGGSLSGTNGGAALSLSGTSRAWIADATLTSGPQACALSGGASNAIRLDRCVVQSALATCAAVPVIAPLLGVERATPLLMGTNFQLTFRSEPNAFVGVFASSALEAVDCFPVLEQWRWIATGDLFLPALLQADATGVATVAWPIPTGPFADLRLWFQGASGMAAPLQVSPVTGGVVR